MHVSDGLSLASERVGVRIQMLGRRANYQTRCGPRVRTQFMRVRKARSKSTRDLKRLLQLYAMSASQRPSWEVASNEPAEALGV
jgi:hypothetical protein